MSTSDSDIMSESYKRTRDARGLGLYGVKWGVALTMFVIIKLYSEMGGMK